jgi:OmcA/MtrC family decaheme c-type cytochrome
MADYTRNCLLAGLFGLLVACGGGGGGDRAEGVEPGPEPPGGTVTPPPPQFPTPAPYAEAKQLFAFIAAVEIPEDGRPVVDFQLSDGNNTAITDLAPADVRFTIAKLQGSPLGNLTGSWQSYINQIEEPDVGPGTAARLQATYERDAGEFTNNGDGSYRYRMAVNLNDLPAEMLAQAQSEGLDLTYEPERTHRVAMQFDNSGDTANPHYDWVPASGATDGVFTMDIAATENCNRCHDPLGLHGGNRREVEYCVTCHNPGSTDANSGNTVDLKVMIHKIHMGAELPSVQAGGKYIIWGFRDSENDYSGLHYPQDVRNCVNCHAGTASGEGREDLVLTSQGDNWTEYPSRAVCGSCHDDLDFASHAGGQADDSRCAGCHSTDGPAGSIEESHLIPLDQARRALLAEIERVDNTMPGEQPTVTFRVSNPLTGEDYDIKNDPVFTGAGARLAVGVAWSTGDYNNTGNGGENASAVQANAIADSVANGDGSYSVTMPVAIPDGSAAPGVAATGSGAATVEGHPVVDVDGDGELDSVPVGDAHAFFSIDEPDGTPVARRERVTIEQCQACHGHLVLHGGNRSDNINSCVTCHNPRNTDRGVREVAANPPTDGKREESIDFKTMIHAIHAPAIRENPLQIVGFGGFSTHVYDETAVHYPGDLANCTTCHTEEGYTLPLAAGVLGTTVDTGGDVQDPADDTVVSPTSAVCSSCHDDQTARAHMTTNGGSFGTTQAAIDGGEVIEQCSVCHGAGSEFDVAVEHDIH